MELARRDKAGTMLGGKGNESPLGRVYHKNKGQRRYSPPLPPAAHPAPDDVAIPMGRLYSNTPSRSRGLEKIA